MGPILLETNNYNNLNEAWIGQSLEEIEDFNYKEVAASFFMEETPKDPSIAAKKTKTFKETWISQLPKILFFTV